MSGSPLGPGVSGRPGCFFFLNMDYGASVNCTFLGMGQNEKALQAEGRVSFIKG